jgi:hypothetical protein
MHPVFEVERSAYRQRIPAREGAEDVRIHGSVQAEAAELGRRVEVVQIPDARRQHELRVEIVDPGPSDPDPAALDDPAVEQPDPADVARGETPPDDVRAGVPDEAAELVGVGRVGLTEDDVRAGVDVGHRRVERPLHQDHPPVAQLAQHSKRQARQSLRL